MKWTPNYNLNKPEQTDYINVDDLNENMDTLDEELKKVSDDLANKEEYVHPDYHEPGIIKQDENNKFVTDEEKEKWNSASEDLEEHINNPMPHRMKHDGKTYKYGFGIDDAKGAVVFKYEEVR